jgi:hypothetical protein
MPHPAVAQQEPCKGCGLVGAGIGHDTTMLLVLVLLQVKDTPAWGNTRTAQLLPQPLPLPFQ